LDEAYFEFAKDERDYPDSLKLLKEYKNLVVTRTFSKAYGLSGLRIGYGIADESIIAALNKVREPFNVNLLAQHGALAAIDDKVHLNRTLRAVKEGRRYLNAKFERLGLTPVPTATNFMLVDLGCEALPVYEKLIRKGIIVRPMTAWGLRDYIRVTIGKRDENRKFVQALREILKEQEK
jgi:histidinol-phosphate aminotransferase